MQHAKMVYLCPHFLKKAVIWRMGLIFFIFSLADQKNRLSFIAYTRVMRIFLSTLLIGAALHLEAQDPEFKPQEFEKIAPKTPEKKEEPASLPETTPKEEGDEKILVEKLSGLIFIKSADQIQKNGIGGIEDIFVVKSKELELLDTPDFKERMRPFLGKPITLKLLNQLRRETVLFYRDHDRPVVNAVVPGQDITTGVIQIMAVEGVAGKIHVEGNQWFESNFLKHAVQLKRGQPIYAKSLLEDINWLNNNPFRHIDPILTPGEEPGQTDIILKVKDRVPYRLYTGYEDSGNELTGDERFLFGFNWGNVFLQDHQMNYQFTGDPHFNKLTAHSGSYIIPLPWRHRLSFFGSHAETTADVDRGRFYLRGISWQTSTRYVISLPLTDIYTHEAMFGLDFKQSNNHLDFNGAQVFNRTTDILQWSVGYNSGLKDPFGNTTFGINVFYSPGNLTDGNTDLNFRTSRAFARSGYVYERTTLERVTKLPWDYTWLIKATHQFSPSGTLLGSEQLGVGGYNTVRGYDEREANGDEGYLFSTELRIPPISPGSLLGLSNAGDQFQILGFWDYGVAENRILLLGEDPSVILSGVGPGMRYSISPYLSLRADYGYQLKDSGNNLRHNSRWHVGIVLSY